MKKLLGLIAILASVQAVARPEVDKSTVCYGVNKHDKQSFKTPCIATSGGGAGVSVLTYQFNGKKYEIVEEDSGRSLNGSPYKDYGRDSFFRRVAGTATDISYYCYQSKKVHFCAKQ